MPPSPPPPPPPPPRFLHSCVVSTCSRGVAIVMPAVPCPIYGPEFLAVMSRSRSFMLCSCCNLAEKVHSNRSPVVPVVVGGLLFLLLMSVSSLYITRYILKQRRCSSACMGRYSNLPVGDSFPDAESSLAT